MIDEICVCEIRAAFVIILHFSLSFFSLPLSRPHQRVSQRAERGEERHDGAPHKQEITRTARGLRKKKTHKKKPTHPLVFFCWYSVIYEMHEKTKSSEEVKEEEERGRRREMRRRRRAEIKRTLIVIPPPPTEV